MTKIYCDVKPEPIKQKRNAICICVYIERRYLIKCALRVSRITQVRS